MLLVDVFKEVDVINMKNVNKKKKNVKKNKMDIIKKFIKENKQFVILSGIILFSFILLIIIVLINVFDNRVKNEKEAEKVFLEYVEYADSISHIFALDESQEYLNFDLEHIRKLSNDEIKELSMCDPNYTYVSIYLNEKGQDRYKAYLDCKFD